ncbi:Site-specific DNA recombinase [Nakamurella panacisegetis]|uniref:Site-specific DNA recombinase n=1 Tax=Nakamurella panacisegetis TaxID=1090615 RepID=A0A1H0JY33_9ACTN|nr:recombinase family protein [Nakamurella panacisegetis]SDO48567.1 Site-specific DNA recombinase [Nakamurella panacisegetis]
MATRRKSSRTRPLALVYVRVSTADQVEYGASLDAQRATLIAEAERRGWECEVVADEGVSAKNLDRPGLTGALNRLDAGDADVLMAIRLDRISRSVADFAGLVDRAGRKGWNLVLLSPALDLSDPAGRFTANVLASAAQYERELISMRTREVLAKKKADGVRLGRPTAVASAVVDRITTARAAGNSWPKIAAALNDDKVATPTGKGRWYPAGCRAIALAADR